MNRASQVARHLYYLIICASCLLRAGSAFAQQPIDDGQHEPARRSSTIIKSENDQREYRYLVLANKLRVLLISDATTEKSAAALDVHVGHNQNPEGREGLAHFLEHMLFLGTEKYPLAGEYQAFISQHGGNHNAYTMPENTNYFFDIDSSHLDPALDRFAQFFTAPLFDATYVERERNAVNAEYLGRLKDDSQRLFDVYREVFNPGHPSSRFSVGSQATLADYDDQSVRDDLLNFYRNYYSAELMTLVVLGKENLDDLEKMVVSRFDKIPSYKVELPTSYPEILAASELPLSVEIKPEKDLRQLSLLFPIPNSSNVYDKKPWHYIGNLLGHEGEGSLLSLLKKLGWAEGLSAGVGAETRHDAFFQVTVQLTEKGILARDQIVPLLFYIIRQIESRGLKDWRYDELKELADIDFRFQEKRPPIDTVSDLAASMQIYSPQDTLRGDYLFSGYDEELIKQCLSFLRLDNLVVVFVSPTVDANNSSSFYQTPYLAEQVELVEREIKPNVRKKLFFPEPNAFIPSRLAVKSQLILPTPSERAAPGSLDRPQFIIRNPRTRAWFKQDQQFHVPKARINLRLKLPLVAASAEGAAQAQLFAALVMDELNEFSYPARLAGLDYSVVANSRGLDITIAGYSSRQGLLLSKIAKSIRKGRFASERFHNLKSELIRSWRNDSKNAPYMVLARQIPVLHYAPYWSNDELIDGLTEKNLEEFHQFATRLLRDAEMEALLYGNFFRQEATKLAALAEYELLGSITGRELAAAQVFALTSKNEKPWLYRHSLDHADNLIQLYIQASGAGLSDTAHMKLLQQILQPAFFDQLRTEKQLGYVVSVFPLALRDLEGSVLVIQSPATDETQLIKEIDDFLERNKESISQNLDENKSALVKQLSEPARTLFEQADYYWDSILLNDWEFVRREGLAKAAEAITPQSINAYYTAVMLEKNRRLWLSTKKLPTTEFFNLVENIDSYQAQQEAITYP